MWVVYSLAAAVLWGGSYTIYSILIKSLSPAASMLFVGMGNLTLYLLIALSRGELATGAAAVRAHPQLLPLILGATACAVGATLLLLFAMKASNATLAALIEITYPLFIALFSWAFLRESQMNLGTFAGALLILSGICCISYFNRSIAP